MARGLSGACGVAGQRLVWVHHLSFVAVAGPCGPLFAPHRLERPAAQSPID